MQRNLLPPELQFAHTFSIALHDRMVELLLRGEAEGLFSTTMKLDGERLPPTADGEVDIFDWLDEAGHHDTLARVYLKAVFPALLSDFLHFVFEALSCSRKSKATVAYALLRKPFTENLTYMEWMLADPDEFLSTFHAKPAQELTSKHIGDKSILIARIEAALAHTPCPELFDPEFLHSLRFDKHAEYGLHGLWTQALHVITSQTPIQTETRNLNFVFATETDQQALLEHLYAVLPMLLVYASAVVDSLYVMATGAEIRDFEEASARRLLGLAIWQQQFHPGDASTPRDSIPALAEVFVDECPSCHCPIRWTLAPAMTAFLSSSVRCSGCSRVAPLHKLMKCA